MPAPARPLTGRLSFRFAVFLALALLPVGVALLLQTRDLARTSEAQSEAALMGATLRAAARETQIILKAQGVAAGLATAQALRRSDTEACSANMRRAAEALPEATLIAFVPVSGLMTCSNTGRTFDFSGDPRLAEVIARGTPSFIVNREAPISQTSVLGITHPVVDETGNQIGFTSISIPHNSLTTKFSVESVGLGADHLVHFWTFDMEGRLLSANIDIADAERGLPVNRTLVDLSMGPDGVFRATSVAGEARTYALVPLIEGEVFLLGGWTVQGGGFLTQSGLGAYVTPAMMWVTALLAAGIGAHLLVTRHIRTLHSAITRFARGDRRLAAMDQRGAPTEIAEAGEAFLAMSETITRGEAQLEDSVHQKEVLLREVHHRVKNNLQLIASIMNMQLRKAQTPESQELLRGLQERIMSLATIHRGLYQTSGQADVRADELFPDIVRQIERMSSAPGRRFEISTAIADLSLTPDQAVPLSLFLTEAMTNAVKYAAGETPKIGVALRREGGRNAVLEVENAANTAEDAAAAQRGARDIMGSTGLGDQLLTAFAQQLGGTLHRVRRDGLYALRLVFPVSALVAGEERFGTGA
jgi:two-component system, sensor histidine kinase PdtaS